MPMPRFARKMFNVIIIKVAKTHESKKSSCISSDRKSPVGHFLVG